MQLTFMKIVGKAQKPNSSGILLKVYRSFNSGPKRFAYAVMRVAVISGILGLPVQAVAIDSNADAGKPEYHTSVFGLYADNRNEGIGNYITADLALVSYSLIRQNSIGRMEQENVIPLFTDFLDALAQALSGQQQANSGSTTDSVTDQALAANIELVSLLQALLDPELADSLARQTRTEYEHIISASTTAESPLWGRSLDYTQYQPRGRYTQNDSLKRYFRAFRYLTGQLFAIKPSAATGISSTESLLQTARIVQFVTLIRDNEELSDKRDKLDRLLSWQFGPIEDLQDSDVLNVLDTISKPHDLALVSEHLFTKAVKESRQPRVIDGLVQINLLEEGQTIQDVMTGWRLLSSRFTVHSAAQQALLFDNTQDYTGPEDALPFGYGVINGVGVKSYPTAVEWLALLGSPAARQQLDDSYESDFEGYAEAAASATSLLRFLQGAELVHAEIAREGLSIIDSSDVLATHGDLQSLDFESINGFLTWQRFLEVLYSRQSYTASAKGLLLTTPERESAGIEAAPDLYRALAHAGRLQWQQSGVASWQRFVEIMDHLATISSQISFGAQLDSADIDYLNDVDKLLFDLTGGEDQPVVVDVHTNPNEKLVVQQATGFARVVDVESSRKTSLRGARLSFHEFKQAIDERLTTEAWIERLDNMHETTDDSF